MVIEEGVVTHKEVIRVVHTRLNRHRRQRIPSAAAVHHGHHRPAPRKAGVMEGAVVAPMVFRHLLPLHMSMHPQPRLQVEHHGVLVHQPISLVLRLGIKRIVAHKKVAIPIVF